MHPVALAKMPNVDKTESLNPILKIAKGENNKVIVVAEPKAFSEQESLPRIKPKAAIIYVPPALNIDIVKPQIAVRTITIINIIKPLRNLL